MRSSSKLLQLTRMLTHGGLIILSFFAVYKLRSVTDLIPGVQLRIPPLDLSETFLFAGISALLFLLLGFFYHCYSLNYLKQQKSSLSEVFLPWVLSIAFLAYMGFGFLFAGGISRFVMIIGAGVSMMLMLLSEHFFHIRQQYVARRSTLALYGHDPKLLENIHAILKQDFPGTIETVTLQDFGNMGARLYVLGGQFSDNEMEQLTDSIRGKAHALFHVPETHMLEHSLSSPMRYGALLGRVISNTPLQGRRKISKRIFDFIASIIGLLLLSPLFLLIALAIKRNSSGPVFYRQQRVGLGGTLFPFVKFRSMYVEDCIGENYGGSNARKKRQSLINSDKNTRKGILQKIQDDPRVTKVGKFLRKTSLDELPSLRNVVCGDMSLVGPRPHMPHEVAQYETWHRRLLTIKPGITGYAQLYGRDSVPFDDEAKLDLWYIQHWSFGLDMYILMATVKVITGGK